MVNTFCASSYAHGQCRDSSESGFLRVPAAIVNGKHWWWNEPSDLQVRDTRQDNFAPVYYRVTSVAIGGDVAGSVARIRIMNLMLGSILLLLAILTSHHSTRSAFIFTFLILSVTLGFFYIASNHPVSWAYAGILSFAMSASSIPRHNNFVHRVVSATIALFSAVFALSARRESVVSIAFVTLMVIITNRKRLSVALRSGKSHSKLLAVVFFAFSIGSAIRLELIRPIYPFNREGFQEFLESFDLDRILKNVSYLPVIGAEILGGTRNDNSDYLGPVGYWAFPMFAAFVLSLVWFSRQIEGGRKKPVDKITIWTSVSISLIAPVVYILPRPYDLMDLNAFPARYLLLLFACSLFFVYLSLDEDGGVWFSAKQLKTLFCLFSIGHALSLYFNFFLRVTQKNVLVNIGQSSDWTEGWWFESISPLSVWFLGVTGSSTALFALYRSNMLNVKR